MQHNAGFEKINKTNKYAAQGMGQQKTRREQEQERGKQWTRGEDKRARPVH